MVTERDRFTKCFGKVFDPQKSKLLILGTLPPYGSEWYYQGNSMMWEILSEALELPELAKSNTTTRKKTELLINNGIALWDIFSCAWRKEGRAGDEFIIRNKELQPNKIYDEIISKGHIEYIIINGLEQALMWFMEYNQEKEIKDLISSKKVISLHQTKWIQNYKADDPKHRLNWVNTIKKALGKPVLTDKPKKSATEPTITTRNTKPQKPAVKTTTKKETETLKPKKIAFVVKKNKTV
jgi:hypothetical protein